jgi:hypothetical protein
MDGYGALFVGKSEGMRPLEIPVLRWGIILKLTLNNIWGYGVAWYFAHGKILN